MGSMNKTAFAHSMAPRVLRSAGAALTLFLALAPCAWGQKDDSNPQALAKQRSDLYLRSTRVPLADLASEVNRLAVLSESCRVRYGSVACGLPDKALESDKLEERYDYYVKGPVEAHAKAHPAKIDRRNWVSPSPQHP